LNFNPHNILVLNFGQIGDVIMGLPALQAIRKRFPTAKITAMIGRSGADIVGITNFADERIIVDRVALLRGNKIDSIGKILKIAADVRRRKFDFVIDIHSLYETNLLGFLSGAKHRLYANRENRSLDFLSNFHPKPPREDKRKHLTKHYLSVLEPLGVKDAPEFVEIAPRPFDLEKVGKLFPSISAKKKRFVGLFPGAGHPSRRWKLEKFAELAKNLMSDEGLQVIVFLGPEEKDLRPEIEAKFPPETLIFDQLTLTEFMAALSKLDVLVSNDTGAVHIGAIAGAFVVLVMDERAPTTYLPLTEKLIVVNSRNIDEIPTEEVLSAARRALNAKSASN
jgi:ADP-heptose:LPS heptosyltransferase